MIARTKDIVFEPIKHTYTHVETGLLLRSVSRVYREFIEPFDAEKISWFVAQKELRLEISPTWQKGDPQPSDQAILERQKIVKAQWEKKRDDAGGYGTTIHDICEKIMLGQEVDPVYGKLVVALNGLFGHYHKTFPEFIAYSMKWGVAGTPDLPLVRQRSDKSIIDIDDFKTNIEKGIVFDSTSLDKKSGKLKHYNRFMLDPVSHLEDCNYNNYALAESIYGVLLEDMFPTHKIGRISLTFVEEHILPGLNDYTITTIPMPYLKLEAIAILNAFNKKYPFKSEKKIKVVETSGTEDF